MRKIWRQNQNDQLIQALNMTSMVSVANPEGTIIYVNDKLCKASGYEKEELIGRNHNIFKSGFHPKTFYMDLWRTISRGEVWTGKICDKKKNGDICWFQQTIFPFVDELGQIEKFVAIKRCLTKLVDPDYLRNL